MALESTPLQIFDFRQAPTSINGRVSFIRNSEASYYGLDGFIHFAQQGQNWLTYSQSFISSSWSKVAVTATIPNNIVSPDGASSGNKITETNIAGEHRLSRNITVTKGALVSISIYLKAGTRSVVQFSFLNAATYTGGMPGVKFDLANGVLLSKSSNVIDYQAVNAGNGWWRLKLTAMPDLGTASGMHLYLRDQGSSLSYQGSSDNYIYAWGAQLEQGSSLSTYTPTTASPYYGLRYNYDTTTSTPRLIGALIEPEGTNLIPYSQLPANAAWKKQYATIATSSVLSPDGTANASKIVEDTRANTQHYIIPNPAIPSKVGETYTFSAYLKAAERKWAYFNLNEVTVHFDLINGVVGNFNDIFTPLIQNVGNGWFRCSATFKVSKTTTTTKIGSEPGNGQPAYSGDGRSGILFWGAQFEPGSKVTSYIRTQAGSATRAADIVTLTKPAGAAHDLFLQRTNGGFWMNDITSNYQVPPSLNEVQVVNFYSSEEMLVTKDETAQTLFSQAYQNVGPNNTKIMIYDSLYIVQTPNKPWSLQRALNKTSPIFRFQVNAGDKWSGDASNPKDKERCELYLKNASLPFNQDVWLSFALRIAPGDPLTLSPSDWCYLGQVHATEDPGEMSTGPVLGIRLEGADTIKIYTASTLENPIKKDPSYIPRASGTFARGTWHRMVLRMRFSPTNGQLQWWQNGTELINISGIGIGYPDAKGPYWKFGIYRSAMRQSVAVEFANMELSYNSSLLNRVNDPLTIA